MSQLTRPEINEFEEFEDQKEENIPRVSNRSGRQLCSHIFQRGPREGQHCPNVICSMSQTLCRTHHNRQIRHQNQVIRERQMIESQSNVERVIDNLLVEELPPIEPSNTFEDIIRMRARRYQHRTYNFLHRNASDVNQLIYKSCGICNQKIDGAKVILDCECEYHLNCYLLIQEEECCLKCGDKINKKEEDYPDCSICLEKVKTDKVKTNCDHVFHKDCIETWMRIGRGQNTNRCPNCRTEFN
jgi:hypothetical protein